MLREVVRALRHDIDFVALCRGFMKERTETQFRDLDAVIKVWKFYKSCRKKCSSWQWSWACTSESFVEEALLHECMNLMLYFFFQGTYATFPGRSYHYGNFPQYNAHCQGIIQQYICTRGKERSSLIVCSLLQYFQVQ